MPTHTPQHYQIVIRGELDPSWLDWFSGLNILNAVTPTGACTTVLSGPLADQAALRGVLNKIWDLNLEIIAVFQSHEPSDVEPEDGREVGLENGVEFL